MEKIKIVENRKITYDYIYHISDIHIENSLNRFEEYKIIYKKIEKVIRQKDVNKSLICITGDIIDFKNNITINGIEQLRYCLNFFANICKVILIAGNHDSNINDSSCIDLIDCIININSKNNIYYLKQSGLYKFNNIIFSVASIYDRQIIDISNITKRNEKYILLHHGLVCKVKNESFNNRNYFTLGDLKHYDMVMLGDIHKHEFLSDNIAYAGSLIQRNYGENIYGHGIIEWDILNNKGSFIEIKNDYGLLVKKYVEGKEVFINCEKNVKLPKNLCVKVQLDKTSKEDVIKKLDIFSKKHKIKGNLHFEGIRNDYQIKLSSGKNIKINDLSNIDIINTLLEEYIKTRYIIDGDNSINNKIKKILEINKNYYLNIKIKQRVKQEIKLKELKFDNIYNYGENNKIIFNNNSDNILIDGMNGFGKTTIIDIICFALFDRTTRISNKSDIMNINKDRYLIELTFMINDIKYRILKTGEKKGKKIEHISSLYKNDIETKEWSKRNFNDYIQNIIGCDYNQFVYLSFITKDLNNEIIDRRNGERQELITNMLNMNYFTDIFNMVKSNLEEKKNKFLQEKNQILDVLNNYDEIEKLTFDNKKYESLIKELEKLEELIIKESKKIKDNRKNIKYVENELITIEDINVDIEDIKVNIQKNKEKLKNINIQLQLLNDKKKNIIIEESIKKKIEDYYKAFFAKKKPKEDINLLYYEIINVNMKEVQLIHDENINLIEKKNRIEKEIYNDDNEIQILENKIIQINKNIQIKQQNEEYELLEIKMEKDLEKLNEKQIIYQEKIENLRKLRKQKITKEQYMFLKTKYTEMSEEIEILEKYYEIININCFPTYIFSICCENITSITNEILKKMELTYSTQIKYNITRIGNKYSTTIDIFKLNNGSKIDASLISSSEKFFINLCFKIALNCFLNISIPRIIIIDEMFECIDNTVLNNILTLLSKIHEYYDDVFIISHMYEIRKNCDKIATISKRNNDSYIYFGEN